jgi:hypothetical protein
MKCAAKRCDMKTPLQRAAQFTLSCSHFHIPRKGVLTQKDNKNCKNLIHIFEEVRTVSFMKRVLTFVIDAAKPVLVKVICG